MEWKLGRTRQGLSIIATAVKNGGLEDRARCAKRRAEPANARLRGGNKPGQDLPNDRRYGNQPASMLTDPAFLLSVLDSLASTALALFGDHPCRSSQRVSSRGGPGTSFLDPLEEVA